MPDETPQDSAKLTSTDRRTERDGAGTNPRIWPAVVIVLVYLAPLWFLIQAPTMIPNAIGLFVCPIVALVLLLVWWLFASRVPRKDRAVGVVLFAALQAWIVFTQESDGVYLLPVAIPVMFTGVIGLLAVTVRMPWNKRCWVVVTMMILCAGVFTALRADGVYGNLAPVLAWRWDPVSGELPAELVETSGRPAEKAILPREVGPRDWPGFRGPARDNRLTGVTFATDWAENPPREVWRRRVGPAWSSFAVVGDYIFTQEQRGDDECVVCYKAATGDEIWTNRVPVRFDNDMGAGPRATPTFDRGTLFTFGATGILQCVDASTGAPVWKRDVPADTDAKLPEWGFAGSPLVMGDVVILFAGGKDGRGVAAYNRQSGEPTWFAGDGSHGYCSGHLAHVAGVPQVLMNSDIGLQAFVPETGVVLWEHRWKTEMNPRCIQPLLPDANSVLIGTAGGQGTRLLHVDRQGTSWSVEEQWTSKGLRPYFNDFVYYQGYCYGFDGNRFTCMDAATGDRRWRAGNYGGQVLLISDMAMLLVLTEKGNVVLVEATPDGHNEGAEIKVLDSKTWNHPVIANGKLFVRNDKEAACFDLPV